MRTVIEKATELSATPVVVTFNRHPLAVIAPGSEPPLITTLGQRARVLGEVGIRALVVLEFDDLAAARAWYESEIYQQAKKLRDGAARLRMVAVQGVD